MTDPKSDNKKNEKAKDCIENGNAENQRICNYVKACADCDPARSGEPAIIDGTRSYTYEELFKEWDRYARAFSALGMTAESGSRVAIGGAIAAEPLFCFYGLNMTGAVVSMFSYPDFLPGGRWKQMVEREKITDLILSDMMVTPQFWYEIEKEKDRLGLRHVILLHTKLGGPCCGPAELVFNEFNYHALQRLEGTVFMEELIRRYADHPIVYACNEGGHQALIAHTSGTTKGTRKPLPFTDQAVIQVLSKFQDGMRQNLGLPEDEPIRIAPSFDFSSFLNMGIVNIAFSTGGTLILTFFGFIHPKFIRALDYYKVNAVFTAGFMVDKWIERRDIDDIDLSSVKSFSCGGAYLPPEKLKLYREFLKKHGYEKDIYRGYGMSETGGAQLLMPENCEDEDILGFPANKDDYRIQDENDHQFYKVDDGVRTGILYSASGSRSDNELDGEKLYEVTRIDGKDFICTNDLIRVNENGSFSYAGRADRYFANNSGVRFEAGIVETLLLAHKNIDRCALVPVLDKRIHDTVPVLYVIPREKGNKAAESIRLALKDIFVNNERCKDSILPAQFVIVDEIPCNSNGKIDIYRITRERLNGTAYNIAPVMKQDERVDISIEKAEQTSSMISGVLPEGMGKDSAFNLFELFNGQPAENDRKKWFNPLGYLFGNSPK